MIQPGMSCKHEYDNRMSAIFCSIDSTLAKKAPDKIYQGLFYETKILIFLQIYVPVSDPHLRFQSYRNLAAAY